MDAAAHGTGRVGVVVEVEQAGGTFGRSLDRIEYVKQGDILGRPRKLGAPTPPPPSPTCRFSWPSMRRITTGFALTLPAMKFDVTFSSLK